MKWNSGEDSNIDRLVSIERSVAMTPNIGIAFNHLVGNNNNNNNNNSPSLATRRDSVRQKESRGFPPKEASFVVIRSEDTALRY